MKKIKLTLFIVLSYFSSFAQEVSSNDSLINNAVDSQVTIDTVTVAEERYQDDLSSMVQSIQIMFNLLGDPDVSRLDKDQMINQSYLKYFESADVQIEDDLDPQRQLPINKNVQSYLQDVVFFYNSIHFNFEIKEIKKGLNDKDQVYYKVSMQERLQGENLYGEEINTIQDRFFEFNLNEERQEFKVVSIYTTKLSEKEDVAAWWNELDLPWRRFFSDELTFDDSLSVSDIISEYPEVSYGDTIIVNDSNSLYFDTKDLFASIKRLFTKKEIVIEPKDSILNLKPLSKFNELVMIDFSYCTIDDVSPLRSILSLNKINASNSLITNLDDLQYLNDLKEVIIDNTSVSNLDVSSAWTSIEKLSLKNSHISDLNFLSALSTLHYLDISAINSEDYSPLEDMGSLVSLDLSASNFTDLTTLGLLLNLTLLRIDDTPINSLSNLNSGLNLEVLSFQNSSIGDISPLLGLEKLKMIYCDNTLVTREIVQEFLLERPKVLIIYETESLQTWWRDLDSNLKSFVQSRLDSVSDSLSTEVLHTIIFTESVDLSGTSYINSLEGFQQLVNIKNLNIEGTKVEDLSPISNLGQLTTLNISHTPITDLSPLSSLSNLTDLTIENTDVSSLHGVENLVSLEIVKADSSAISQEEALQFKDSSSALLLYQSAYLSKWWNELDDEWMHFFSNKLEFNKNPSPEELQELVNIDSLVLQGISVNSIDEIEEFKMLSYLKLDNMNVSDMSVLSSLPKLESLVINNAMLSDYQSIQKAINLSFLDLSSTSLNSIDFIVTLVNLKNLNISSTTIESIKPIIALGKLEVLDLSNTRVKRINYLNKLENLKELKLTNTVITQRKINSFQRIRPEVKVVFY